MIIRECAWHQDTRQLVLPPVFKASHGICEICKGLLYMSAPNHPKWVELMLDGKWEVEHFGRLSGLIKHYEDGTVLAIRTNWEDVDWHLMRVECDGTEELFSGLLSACLIEVGNLDERRLFYRAD